jgi:hypothetical protein
VIRDAVDAYTTVPLEESGAAVERLIGLEAPVDEWDVMKAQIQAGSVGSRVSQGSHPRQR